MRPVTTLGQKIFQKLFWVTGSAVPETAPVSVSGAAVSPPVEVPAPALALGAGVDPAAPAAAPSGEMKKKAGTFLLPAATSTSRGLEPARGTPAPSGMVDSSTSTVKEPGALRPTSALPSVPVVPVASTPPPDTFTVTPAMPVLSASARTHTSSDCSADAGSTAWGAARGSAWAADGAERRSAVQANATARIRAQTRCARAPAEPVAITRPP